MCGSKFAEKVDGLRAIDRRCFQVELLEVVSLHISQVAAWRIHERQRLVVAVEVWPGCVGQWRNSDLQAGPHRLNLGPGRPVSLDFNHAQIQGLIRAISFFFANYSPEKTVETLCRTYLKLLFPNFGLNVGFGLRPHDLENPTSGSSNSSSISETNEARRFKASVSFLRLKK